MTLLALAQSYGISVTELQWLLAHHQHKTQLDCALYFNTVTEQDLQDLRPSLQRLKAGEPLAYIIGHESFWKLNLTVNPAVLVPRPETECLLEKILSLLEPGPQKILELGAGSGAVAINLAMERPAWEIWALEKSPAALAVCQKNITDSGLKNVRALLSDWFTSLPKDMLFSAIISNPPYLSDQDPNLEALRFEPIEALCAGPTGLEAFQAIVENAPYFLADPAYLLLEHGTAQAEPVQALLRARGFTGVFTHTDYAGHARITGGFITGHLVDSQDENE